MYRSLLCLALLTSAGALVGCAPEETDGVRTAEAAALPTLYTYFAPDNLGGTDGSQCLAAIDSSGQLVTKNAAPYGTFSDQIIVATNSKPGGCQQAFAIYDPGHRLDQASFGYVWGAEDGGDSGQCQYKDASHDFETGYHAIPIVHQLADLHLDNRMDLTNWSQPVRLDMDNRAGGCRAQFVIGGSTNVALETQLSPVNFTYPGFLQCTRQTQMVAKVGRNSDFIIDTDDRGAGCRELFRLTDAPVN